jgi:hypothetical protein
VDDEARRKLMRLWPRIFYFMSGLLYPGALGAALTWLSQGLVTHISGTAHISRHALSLALWFTVYHSLLFVRLMDRYDQWCSDPTNTKYTDPTNPQYTPEQKYGIRPFLSDVIDSLALFGAFMTLGFFSEPETPRRIAGTFLAAIAVPLSAVVAHGGLFKKGDKLPYVRPFLIIFTVLLAVLGACVNWPEQGPSLHACTGPLIFLMWAALVAYITAVYAWED